MANFLEHSDAIGTATSGGFAILGTILGFIQSTHLPPIIIETAQLLSYCGAIFVAGITIYKNLKRKKSE